MGKKWDQVKSSHRHQSSCRKLIILAKGQDGKAKAPLEKHPRWSWANKSSMWESTFWPELICGWSKGAVSRRCPHDLTDLEQCCKDEWPNVAKQDCIIWIIQAFCLNYPNNGIRWKNFWHDFFKVSFFITKTYRGGGGKLLILSTYVRLHSHRKQCHLIKWWQEWMLVFP